MNKTALWIFAASLTGCGLQAQTNPLVKEMRAQYEGVKGNLLKAADKMTEENYSFKPTPEVRTFGALIGHIAGQIRTCAMIKGEQKTIDATKTAKADLVAALKASFDECDAAWDTMDASAMEMIAGRGGQQRTKLSALIQSTIIHNNEMYGYMCPYMRLKGVTPPSSDR
ncbi:conserved exported hypothetical protein [Candidatus Sulfopaludibacter sp. SbA3]|nr:conserved exported hypothetical protein [Candidatus Sulfopaludibacter sp. SbA3]